MANIIDLAGNTLVVGDIQWGANTAGIGATGQSAVAAGGGTSAEAVLTSTPAATTPTLAITIGSTATGSVGVYYGKGAPTSTSALQGSLYLRTDGANSTSRSYIATGTGWTAITTAA